MGFHAGETELFSVWTDCKVPKCLESLCVFRFYRTKQMLSFMFFFFFPKKALKVNTFKF